MGAWSEKIMARIRERVEQEADSIGVEMVQDIQANISHPVERDDAGNVIGRSPEGSNPYLETGNLRASERHDIDSDGNGTTLRVINDAAYARRLHDGHGADSVFGPAGPRPFHDLALGDWRSRFKSRMRETITGKR
jgi:hypothetical protein